MPTAFSAEERTRITRALLEEGRARFTTQGLRKTSLEELVAPAQIAKSSFYQFFDSKEALYLELMLRQMAQVKRKVVDEGLLSTTDVREGLRRFLHAALTELSADPLYRRLMTHPEEMTAVARKLDPSVVTTAPDNPVTALYEFVAAKHAEGELHGGEPAVIVGVLQAVLLLPVNADRLASPEHYPRILDLLIDIVTTGLTTPRARPHGTDHTRN
ncbi:TetR/AcrR family transcriptional regulator [Streptomonospora sp. S1-112]|uniref:TetR/AcrR family transcriptional regulator n=1 Tax=Streptomonospora mangrovi TaxID=2883123 RepID=A0A9X3NYP5_9ACTN|nr:TetR/AcrR family transcriptional regulator [Streptomonospora mangrovi]MDA0566856.1 TetR/AcrR family transcriptional regulator [Streptomonospora mangrovi]